MHTLTLAKVKAARNSRPYPSLVGDGGGLYLQISPTGAKSWIQRISVNGRRQTIGLGPWPVVSLNEARDLAIDNRRLVRAGGDPLAERRRAKMPTFRHAAAKTIAAECGAWKGGLDGLTADHWRASFERHAFPAFADCPVNQIHREDLLRILTPIWTKTPEAGRKLLRRCHAVFEWAEAKGLIERNPAGKAIHRLLPKAPAKQSHYRALPYAEIAGALRIIEASPSGMAAKACLRFTILTAVRSGEARLATWAEIDLEARTWTIPAAHTKTNREHRVPLSALALEVLEGVRILDDGSGLCFPSPVKRGRPLSNMAGTKLLRDAGLAERGTVHGFRSSFRDWCAETGKPREIAEAALAHVVGGVEGAYFRSDLFDRRRRLMQQWATFLGGESADVVELHATAKRA